jgi:hypothetical protein
MLVCPDDRRVAVLIALLALLLQPAQAAPAEVSSLYSEPDSCVAVPGPGPVTQRCQGYDGWAVYIGTSDHGAGLVISDRAWFEQFAQNPIPDGARQVLSPRVEWRVRRVGEDWKPFATIHRLTSSTADDDPAAGDFTAETAQNAQLLVVTVLRRDGPIGACHAAYVDVTTVYDANTIARLFADAMADEFRCGVDAPYEIGAAQAVRLMERGRL